MSIPENKLVACRMTFLVVSAQIMLRFKRLSPKKSAGLAALIRAFFLRLNRLKSGVRCDVHNQERHPTSYNKRIRSFARYGGTGTPGQKAAFDRNWLHHSYELSQGLITTADKPLILEIGFGMGHALSHLALQNPDKQFIGVEVYRPSIGSLLMKIEKHNIQNIKLFQEDAVEVLQHCIPDHCLDAILLFFPDPWHKKRHHKRRLVSPEFISLITKKLKPNGYFHVATDWEDYANHTEVTMAQFANFKKEIPGNFLGRAATKYEARGQRLGHGIWDLIYTYAG